MLKGVIRALVGIAGGLALLGAAYFLVSPEKFALELGVGARDTLGVATLRGDFAALFGVTGVFALAGAILNRRHALAAPALIMAIALSGRLVNMAVLGGGPAVLKPMAVEAGLLIVFVLGRQLMPDEA